MKLLKTLRSGAAVCFLLPGLALRAPAESSVDFNFHIRPILSDRCFVCHGPDENARKAGLRLDTPEGALGALKRGGHVIQPGRPGESELVRRITATDPNDRMPPPGSNLALSSKEIALIQQWIEEGAEWKPHWSFIPVAREVPVPAVRQSGWARNPIDQFVLERLEQEGLSPSAEASRERLLRRVTFDLTGLPPTLEELDAFLEDEAPGAYERAVDRLLASPAYGERMAIEWLDVARYADTHGYQADRYRSVWPWRDWVIKALNENLPFDQFITWQLAGDLLPLPTQEQRLATAFNRLHLQTEEGGSVEEEFRVAYVVDRVNTFGTAFLGLTLDCARCHDHKYDPIPQREYYQLSSFFNNIDESGQTSHFTDSMPVPTLLLADEQTERALERMRASIREKEAQRAAVDRNAQAAFAAWLESPGREPVLGGLAGHFPLDGLVNGKFVNHARPDRPGDPVENPRVNEAERAVMLSGENGIVFKGLGEFSRTDPFSFSLWMQRTDPAENAVILHRSQATLDAGSRGYELVLEDNRISAGLHHMWPGNSLKITSLTTVPLREWVHIAVTYDGSSRAEGLRLYWNGEPAPVTVVRDNLYKDILYERVNVELTLGLRFRDHGFRGGLVREFKLFNRELTPVETAHLSGRLSLGELLAKAPARLEGPERAGLFDYFQAHHNPLFSRHLAELRALRQRLSQSIQSIPEIMVMEEMEEPRPAHVLFRGAYDQPREPVLPGTPSRIKPFDESYPPNRRGLAQWLLAPDHPLTARVLVNRYWQLHFGRGLVATPDDFGAQGQLPSHPELLDWLARHFIDSGWDLKALHRAMVTSAAYRQTSAATLEQLNRDPDNQLLARGPRHRLPAEMIRDQALAASGLLVAQVGGPSVKPYQPEGLWEEKSGGRYEPDQGEGLYRKSLYTFWKRTSPHPAMMTFDASERNHCVAARQATSTPLQALVLLNDPQFVEAARKLSERMHHEGGATLEEQAAFLFRLLTSRNPSPQERAVLVQLYLEQRELFASHPRAALELLTVGDSPACPLIAPAELAAGTALANALLSYDETVMKR